MTAVPDDLMATDREVEMVCTCGEAWIVFVPDGEDLTQDQAECPVCGGEGEER